MARLFEMIARGPHPCFSFGIRPSIRLTAGHSRRSRRAGVPRGSHQSTAAKDIGNLAISIVSVNVNTASVWPMPNEQGGRALEDRRGAPRHGTDGRLGSGWRDVGRPVPAGLPFDEDADPAELLVAASSSSLRGWSASSRSERIRNDLRFEAASRWSRWAPPSGSGMISSMIAEPEQVAAGHLQRLGGLGGVLARLPEDRGAALGADDRVIGVLEHRQAVADADAQRPPEPPSPMTTQTIGVSSWLIASRFSAMISGLAALLGGDARIGARRVDEGDDRQAELGRQPHLRPAPCGSPRGGRSRSCRRSARRGSSPSGGR